MFIFNPQLESLSALDSKLCIGWNMALTVARLGQDGILFRHENQQPLRDTLELIYQGSLLSSCHINLRRKSGERNEAYCYDIGREDLNKVTE